MKESLENIVALSDIRERKLRASSPYGPVKVGLTIWPGQEIAKVDPLAQLMELLSSLESVVHDLNYKSFTAYDTLNTATENLRRVLLSDIVIEGAGTNE
jgi:hypothetical protein